jgi:hypothetical protein
VSHRDSDLDRHGAAPGYCPAGARPAGAVRAGAALPAQSSTLSTCFLPGSTTARVQGKLLNFQLPRSAQSSVADDTLWNRRSPGPSFRQASHSAECWSASVAACSNTPSRASNNSTLLSNGEQRRKARLPASRRDRCLWAIPAPEPTSSMRTPRARLEMRWILSGARRSRRRQTLPASFPSSNVTRSIALPG